MQTIYDIGTVLFWPFTHYLIGEVIWLAALVMTILWAKRGQKLKTFLLWWLIPLPILVIIFRILGNGHGGFMGMEGTGIYNTFFDFSIVLLWFFYFPILAAIYFWTKQSTPKI